MAFLFEGLSMEREETEGAQRELFSGVKKTVKKP
jgi:hypothetical protein